MVENKITVGVPFMGTQNDTYAKGKHKGLQEKGKHKGLPLRKYYRRSIRLKHYDYSTAGFYFITIVAQNREHLFCEIVEGEMVLNEAGRMIHTLWYEIKDDFPNVYLHSFVIMPNHIHGIIEITNNENISKPVGVPLVRTQNMVNGKTKITSRAPITSNKGQPQGIAPTVGNVVGSFKSKTTNTYIKMVKNGTLPPFNKRIWQRNYYEHVVRDDVDYVRLATYIQNNHQKWEEDMFLS